MEADATAAPTVEDVGPAGALGEQSTAPEIAELPAAEAPTAASEATAADCPLEAQQPESSGTEAATGEAQPQLGADMAKWEGEFAVDKAAEEIATGTAAETAGARLQERSRVLQAARQSVAAECQAEAQLASLTAEDANAAVAQLLASSNAVQRAWKAWLESLPEHLRVGMPDAMMLRRFLALARRLPQGHGPSCDVVASEVPSNMASDADAFNRWSMLTGSRWSRENQEQPWPPPEGASGVQEAAANDTNPWAAFNSGTAFNPGECGSRRQRGRRPRPDMLVDGVRVQVFDGQGLTGRLRSWGKKKHGWIVPDEPIAHEKAYMHRGDVFVSARDADCQLQEGMRVAFRLYVDHDGLGAERVRPA